MSESLNIRPSKGKVLPLGDEPQNPYFAFSFQQKPGSGWQVCIKAFGNDRQVKITGSKLISIGIAPTGEDPGEFWDYSMGLPPALGSSAAYTQYTFDFKLPAGYALWACTESHILYDGFLYGMVAAI